MKMRKLVAAALAMLMLLTATPLAGFVGMELPELAEMFTVKAEAATNYKVGDIIEFGSYPQSEVTDENVLSVLNAHLKEYAWESYGYYSGAEDYGTMSQSDYMKYIDVSYNNKGYRAVKFTTYRPTWAEAESTVDPEITLQDENGYFINNVYWFEYEPIEWRVLDPSTGLVMCETLIDSQPFTNTIYVDWDYCNNGGDDEDAFRNDSSLDNYACDYETSSLRTWLTDDFYETAFSSSEKKQILKTTLDNSSPYDSQYDSASTYDNIFLLSYSEMMNSAYGFDEGNGADTAREAQGSDYAKSQGLMTYSYQDESSEYAENSWWRLRSPGVSSMDACYIGENGRVSTLPTVESSLFGIRPALRLSFVGETTYTLTYNANGGSGAPSAQSGNTSYTISRTKPTRSGYTFLGWSKSSSATSASYTAGGIISISQDTTLYAVWQKNAVEEDIYNLGEETYSFDNFSDSESGGHCFGMSITSSAYHIGELDITSVGGNKTDDVYSLSPNSTVKSPICYYQKRQNVELIQEANVAGGMYYETYNTEKGTANININSDWAEIIAYIKNHSHDGIGNLQMVFYGEYDFFGFAINGGHAVNFLRYEEVNGQQRIYVYDNNFPDVETYFCKNSRGKVVQEPYATFDISIYSMTLVDVGKYFDVVDSFDVSRYIYADANKVRVEGALVHPMICDTQGGLWVIYEIPDSIQTINVIPLENNAEFVYLDNSYSFGSITSETVGIFTIPTSSPGEIGSGAKAEFTIINGTAKDTSVAIQSPSTTEINYGDSIILHADVTGALPAGARIVWEPSNGNFSTEVSADGKTCKISPDSSGDTTFKVYVVDANNKKISEEDTQTMTSNAGFFQKIIAFFKKLFGLTKTIPQLFDGLK